jgi:hypothetical protein
MLFPMFIHTKPLKVYIPPRSKLRFHRPRDVNRTLHIQLLDPALHDAELESDDACHFNRAAEGDLAVALAEMQVPDTKLGTGDVDG